MRILKWNRFSVATLVLLALAGGCRDGGDAAGGADEGGEPERGGTAILVEASDINRPVPLISETSLDGNVVASMLFMGLTAPEWRDGRLLYLTSEENPLALSRRYEFAGPDSSILRYHMRTDVLWTDGTRVTARDAAFTYDVIDDPELASARQDFSEHMDSVVVENDSTVAFHFDRRYPDMLFHSAQPLLPAHVFADVPPGDIRNHPTILDPVQGKLVSNGPFVIGSWQKGQQVTFVPNPRFRPQPYLEQIVIRVIAEATTRLVELQTGNVDFVHQVGFDQIAGLKAQAPHVNFAVEKRRSYEYIGYNPAAHPAFADPEIRRALGLALNVPSVIQGLEMGDYAEPAGGPYSPVLGLLHDPVGQAPLKHDLARAKQILESKGWRDTNGDGIREKDGKALRFTLSTNTGNARRADAMQIVQQQWRAAGVDAQLQQLEANTFFDKLTKREYEAVVSGWSVGLAADISDQWQPDATFNVTDYTNPQLAPLFEQASAQPTEESAAPFWKRAASLIVRDQPYTWLYYYDTVNGVHERLRGMEINTLGRYQNPWEWWIPASQQRGRAAAPAAKDSGAAK